MALSVDDVKALLVALLPPGSESLYALRNSDNIGGLFYGISKALKAYGIDRLAQLRLELNPSTIVEKIPDWEEACGLTNTPIAQFGTIDQRRNAVLSVLRAHGSFSLDDMRAAVQPYFLYADPSQIEIIETNRFDLLLAHTYVNPGSTVIGISSNGSLSVSVLDDPRVSPAGAIVVLQITGSLDELGFRITGPDGRQEIFPPGYLGYGIVTTQELTFYCPFFAGAAIRGVWTITAYTGSINTATIEAFGVSVEGLGVNYDRAGNRIGQGLGAAIYEFAVVADPALLGTGYDLNAAYRTIRSVKPAHTIGTILIKNSIAGICAIPDEAQTIPDACIPC